MHARIVSGRYRPEAIDEGVALYRDVAVPVLRQLPGCHGILGLIDRATGRTASITLWATGADLAANTPEDFLRGPLVSKFAALMEEGPVVTMYEAVIEEWGPSPS